MQYKNILKKLKELSNPRAVEGMARFGINPKNTYGVSIPNLRNIGKRNHSLNRKAIETAKKIQKMDSKSAKWIASDAIRELTGKAVQERLQKRCK